MTAWAFLGEDCPARTLVARPTDMAIRLGASWSESKWGGVSPPP
jgi:hypothetical protein